MAQLKGNPAPLHLRAGPLMMVFEPDSGFLRYLRLGEREVLRGIYAAVRDRNWGTVTPHLSNLQADVRDVAFTLRFDVECVAGSIDFAWHGILTGDAGGTVSYSMDGRTRSTFLRNRIGFCVLHPMQECAGLACEVEKADGTRQTGAFPFYIAPQQPFSDLRAVTHEVMPGVRAEVRFAGDVFEMEDQRNWTDASFKTYCTPLHLPYPVEIAAGTRISQSVALRLQGDVPELVQQTVGGSPVRLTVQRGAVSRLPALGLGVASHGQALSGMEVERLRALSLSHLRVDVDLRDAGFAAALQRVARQAAALDAALEMALFLSDRAEAELRVLRECWRSLHQRTAIPRVARWLVFHHDEKCTSARWVQSARETLSSLAPDAPVGAGTNAYFTELNRERPEFAALDVVSYSINPQVHACDDASLMETLPAQAATVESARQFCGNTPIAVSPITLKPRFNPDATGPVEDAPGQLPPAVDARQARLLGAAWTLGSLKYLAESGAGSATYYETTGWRGVMETEQGSPLPDEFTSVPGAVFPLYHVLADAGEFAAGDVLACDSSAASRVIGMALQCHGRTRIVVANLTATLVQVELDCGSLVPAAGGIAGTVRQLDDTTLRQATLMPEDFRRQPGVAVRLCGGATRLDMQPYAVLCVDLMSE